MIEFTCPKCGKIWHEVNDDGDFVKCPNCEAIVMTMEADTPLEIEGKP